SLTFIGAAKDLAAADSSTGAIVRLSDPLSGAAPEVLYTAANAPGTIQVAAATNGRKLVLLDGGWTVRTIDLRSGSVAQLDCDCTPTLIQTLRGGSIFRLTESLMQPIWVLDADGSDPRLMFLPAAFPAEVAQP